MHKMLWQQRNFPDTAALASPADLHVHACQFKRTQHWHDLIVAPRLYAVADPWSRRRVPVGTYTRWSGIRQAFQMLQLLHPLQLCLPIHGTRRRQLVGTAWLWHIHAVAGGSLEGFSVDDHWQRTRMQGIHMAVELACTMLQQCLSRRIPHYLLV